MDQREALELSSLGKDDATTPTLGEQINNHEPVSEREASSEANVVADAVAGAQANSTDDVSPSDDPGIPASRPGTPTGANLPQQENCPHQENYWTQIAPLVECLPHLRILPIDHQSRYPGIGKVVCIDYVHGTSSPQVSKSWSFHRFSRRAPGWRSKIQRLKTDLPADLATRVILVEDLSDQLIEALGSTFKLDPDVFAEHLARAAHYKDDHDENPKLSEWLQKPAMLLDERELVSRLDNKTKIERGISWLDRARETLHLVTPNTNIFRRSWDLSEASDELEDFVSTDLPSETSDLELTANAAHSAWSEFATICKYEDSGKTIVIILLDPLPAITDQTRSAGRKAGAGRQSARTTVQCFAPLAARLPVKLPQNKLEATAEDISQLQRSTQVVTSTTDAIRQRICELRFTPNGVRICPLVALCEVISSDTKAFVCALEAALERIGKDSLDKCLVQRRLADWRRLMNDFQTEIPAVISSLHNFVNFVSESRQNETLNTINQIVSEMTDELSSLQAKVEQSHAALRFDMQFSESRRSIREAKTVTKLTELAFIFIPLSFVSSLFSMSLKVLEDRVPIWTFILTALTVALLAYGVRFVVANDYFAVSSRRALERLWTVRNVRRGTNIPTSALTLLTIQEIWNHGGKRALARGLTLASMAAFIVVPVGFLWTSTALDTGFKISLTLLLALSGVALAMILGTAVKYLGTVHSIFEEVERGENSGGSACGAEDV